MLHTTDQYYKYISLIECSLHMKVYILTSCLFRRASFFFLISSIFLVSKASFSSFVRMSRKSSWFAFTCNKNNHYNNKYSSKQRILSYILYSSRVYNICCNHFYNFLTTCIWNFVQRLNLYQQTDIVEPLEHGLKRVNHVKFMFMFVIWCIFYPMDILSFAHRNPQQLLVLAAPM